MYRIMFCWNTLGARIKYCLCFKKKMSRFKPNIYHNIILIFIILGTLGILNLFISNIVNDENNQGIRTVNIGGNFRLIDQKNNVYDSTSHEVYKLIYFGYTYCPDVCPFDILKLSRVYKENPKLKIHVKPIFITVDPERDTVEVMHNFLENFDENIIGLTGSNSEINDVMKKYKIATIAGDGIGKEIVPESLKVLKEVARKHQFKIQFDEFDF